MLVQYNMRIVHLKVKRLSKYLRYLRLHPSYLERNHWVNHSVHTHLHGLRLMTVCHADIIFKEDVSHGEFKFVVGKIASRTGVAATTKYAVVWARLDELTEFVARLALAQETVTVKLLGVGISGWVP